MTGPSLRMKGVSESCVEKIGGNAFALCRYRDRCPEFRGLDPERISRPKDIGACRMFQKYKEEGIHDQS